MNTEVIIVKDAGHDIPKGYLQAALKNCPTYLGLSVQGDDGNGQPLLETSAEKKTYDIDELVKLLESMKDVRVVLQLGNMHHDFDESSDMMPYTFQVAPEKKGDDPVDILAIHLEGDFANYSKPGEGHTETYNLWDDYLYPTISEKFEAAEDLDNFFDRLRQTSFEKAVLNTVGHRGVAVFVPQYGEIVSFGRNELGAKYDWGTVSNHFDWGKQTKLEAAATAAVAAVKKPMGRLARAMGSTAVTPPAPETEDDPKKHVHHTEATPKKLNEPGKDDNDPFAKWPGTSSKTHKMVSVPIGLQGNAKNRWIRTFLGLSPDAELPKGKDHKDFKLPVALELIGFAQEAVSTNDDVKRLQSRIVRFQTPGSKEDAQPVTEPEEKNPQVQQPSKEQKEVVEDRRPPADFLPEMSADDAKISTDLATEWATNPKRPKALEIQKITAKWPKFSEGRGIKFTDFGQWTIADIKLLGKKAPNALALAFVELQSKLFELGAFDEGINTEHVNDKETKPETSKSQTPSGAPAKSGPAPTKGGRLARAKGTAA